MELVAYSRYLSRSAPPHQLRVVILAQGRTGSTVLEDLICASGHFQKNGELLQTSRGEVLFPVPFILGSSRRSSDRHFIFHLKVYHLTRDRRRPVDPGDFLRTLHDEAWKILHLRRENKIRHVLSNFVAEARGAYHKFDGKDEGLSLHIDIDRFIDKVRERFQFEEAERAMLRGVGSLEIVYEDDLERQETHHRTSDKILDYLALERRSVSTRYRKINALPLHRLISNYHPFEERMIEEGWGGFLDPQTRP
jgi:LPS sulfotransferase NodH